MNLASFLQGRSFAVCLFILMYYGSIGQVAININGNQPDNSAMLDIQSNEKGLLIPRMSTAQINAIANPANGLMLYDTDKKAIVLFNVGKGWNKLDVSPSGRIYISETYPDTLYPSAEYDYLGVFLPGKCV